MTTSISETTMTESSHIFISYARRDGSDNATKLDDALSQKGFKTWRDRRGLDPTQDFTAQIENAIQSSLYVVTCITHDVTRGDSFVRREISYALLLHKPMVVVRFSDVTPPITIINCTWIDFFANWEEAFTQLCDALRSPSTHADSTIPRGLEDPYRTYLEALYKQTVHYLDKTVLSILPGKDNVSLLSLPSRATPEAVDTYSGIEAQALPMAFFAMAGIEETEPDITYTSFHEAFEKYAGRTLLLGDPGSGKTTTLMAFGRDAIAKRLEDTKQPLPILAPISLWDPKTRPSLVDWLGEVIPPLRESIADIIADGKGLLLLDGLDELGEKRVDSKTKTEYDPRPLFIQIMPSNNRIVLSCRKREYYAIGQKVAVRGAVTLMPLDDLHIQQYLTNTPELWEVLQTDKELREVARIPLLLSLFAFAFSGLEAPKEKFRDLAKGDLRDAVFETYIRRRYEHEKRKPQANIPFTLDEIYNLLGYMTTARVSILSGGGWWDRPIVLKLEEFKYGIGEERGVALAEAATSLNLLISDDTDSFRFIHLLLRDHFAYRFALEFLHSDRGPTRRAAIIILGELGDERSIEPLITALTDHYPTVRWHAGRALKKISHPRAIEPLIRALSDNAHAVPLDAYDQTPLLYSIAAEALVSIGEPAVDPLIIALHDDNVNIRGRAADVLGRLKILRAVQPLCELLAISKASEKTDIVWAEQSIPEIIVQALTSIGTPEALEAVRQWMAKRDPQQGQ